MKRYFKSIVGVTLLEIMLVLAIAAMIIVMSIRYYQSATAQQQVNATLEQVQAISVAADSWEQSSGTYSGLSDNTSGFSALLPANGLKTLWGTAITVAGAGASYTITIASAPASVCAPLAARFSGNVHYSASCSSGNVDITYNSAGNG